MSDRKVYAEFEDTQLNIPVAVNPAHVQNVWPNTDTSCEIGYAGKSSTFVKGTFTEVTAKLNAALAAQSTGERGPAGPVGRTGPAGPEGPAGPAGGH